MLRDKQKIVRVLDELLTYVLRSQPQKVQVTIEELADRIQIKVEDTGIPMDTRECQEAESCLNIPRRKETQDYYGGLAGEEPLTSHSLRIVGMMVDGGSLKRSKNGFSLAVWWKPE